MDWSSTKAGWFQALTFGFTPNLLEGSNDRAGERNECVAAAWTPCNFRLLQVCSGNCPGLASRYSLAVLEDFCGFLNRAVIAVPMVSSEIRRDGRPFPSPIREDFACISFFQTLIFLAKNYPLFRNGSRFPASTISAEIPMHRRVLALSILVVCPPVFAQDAQSFRSGPEHTGVYKSPGMAAFHKIKWQFHSGGQILSSPVVAADTVYFGSNDHHIHALNLSTGAEKWKFKTGGRVPSTPAVAQTASCSS
jgi:PQQ enzyme repeat